ncbi:UDP-N-acetylmuramoyl-L-alanyl-D-glutamate--2,6-diaminopimelate ligase [Blattabacterium cuenoti]|uniref:UDP-N-acetylmuramoyl-L-alanyl-D-glutamate--2, 6-diaminopimelate ligase n=1 Tax=Blattabacterium cuenoti TaxID=1653831 RepID=UPI00163B6870|nr:UDP-N-acetylmuramoyl-L-alanyl-D-glutamate--2,6-diaminopimelate ligase [Blattabacterium cuenoti]
MKKSLQFILKNIPVLKIIGNDNKFIEGMSTSSKSIKNNMIFIAYKGQTKNGHNFIEEAIKKGATVIICEKIHRCLINHEITYVLVKKAIDILGNLASNYYDNPTKKIKLIGITGTNGKTTVSSILYQLFFHLGEKPLLISTTGIIILDKKLETIHTTPNIIDINKYLHLSIKKGCKYAFMEVSSHGIHQNRINGLSFFGGIFTNITHDHLDYHKSFNNYLYIKKTFFEKCLTRHSFALINADDQYSHIITQNLLAKLYFYGIIHQYNCKIEIINQTFYGNLLMINGYRFMFPLIGKFNVYNLLASYRTAAILLEDEDKESIILKNLKNIIPIQGRCEQFITYSGIHIIVDYAHNPNGLKNLLISVNNLKSKTSKLLCIIGCGGNRDKTKRPLMGKIVYNMCDISIFTSDNPRNEDPEEILHDMKKFILFTIKQKVLFTIVDRKQAIKYAIKIAKTKDIILILGKGHENYQEIKGNRYPFNDMIVAKQLLTNK